MGAVREIVLDESVLFAEDASGNPCLHPASAFLLRRLRHSNLRVGICYQEDATSQKAAFVQGIAATHSLDSIPLSGTDEDLLQKFLLAWNGTGSSCLFITSRKIELFFSKLRNIGWIIVYVGVDSNVTTDSGFININTVQAVPITICNLNKMAMHEKPLVIGYIMKPSREEDFCKRGAFPLYPTHNGLLFLPLSFELPLAPQIKQVDVVLHKATDEIISIDTSLDFSNGILFSKGMNELKRNIEDIPDCCVIDPLNNIYPLLDRHKIQEILYKLDEFNIKGHCKLRAPHFLKVDNYDYTSLQDQLSEAKLSFPMIVKPQVACGVADAHNMALIFKTEDFENLCVPLPAIIQEYVDHGSLLFKFYVLGERVFHTVKKSMPNATHLLSISGKSAGSSFIFFNSLKSLPVAQEDNISAGFVEHSNHSIDLELVSHAAQCLRKWLGLTIFGFDVVIEEGSRDHVIVDLNYLPSFKEIPDSDAIPAFWEAIKSSYEYWRATRAPKP
ncbi:hypothetical protein KFK09_029233 [Dendrobium nobile]|uniref:Inositol-tetrakisphosphate 1-kinase 6 n=1 Tax=Dendrobium nobile TaxID=94219 RepID=A0A8T3A560_DENNO|nr:hypothetical protein KFK09_029233 [Dendrobium nobile]